MGCKHCGRDLNVVHTKEVDGEIVQTMVCTNSKCSNYCGNDLNKPIKVAEVVRTPI